MVNMLLNAEFGDGYVRETKSGKCELAFTNTNKSLIEYKARILGSNVQCFKQSKKAWGKKPIFRTGCTRKLIRKSKLESIQDITLEDFILWYLDDGSYHKNYHSANLNSHSLNRAENIELQFHLWRVFGLDSNLAIDKKKDGRMFFYLRFKRDEFSSMKLEIKNFMNINNIIGLEYKVGEASQTSA